MGGLSLSTTEYNAGLIGESLTMKNPISDSAQVQDKANENNVGNKSERKILYSSCFCE